jgi:hypothetical protein
MIMLMVVVVVGKGFQFQRALVVFTYEEFDG